jgi:hypothetical protein
LYAFVDAEDDEKSQEKRYDTASAERFNDLVHLDSLNNLPAEYIGMSAFVFNGLACR